MHQITPFHNMTTMQQNNMLMHPLIQNGFQQLLTEVQKINIHLNDVESANKNILTNQQ